MSPNLAPRAAAARPIHSPGTSDDQNPPLPDLPHIWAPELERIGPATSDSIRSKTADCVTSAAPLGQGAPLSPRCYCQRDRQETT